MKHKGFTLIELLVVISIIGVLSTVILGSLGSARNSAKDAKIKAMMGQMRTQAEIFNIRYGSYRGTSTTGYQDDSISECKTRTGADGSVFDENTEGNFYALIDGVTDLTEDITNRIRCGVTSSSSGLDNWAFAVPLFNPEDGFTGWCVDSSGSAKSVNIDFSQAGSEMGLASTGLACP